MPDRIDWQGIDDRYSRQRLIAGWDQEKLAHARVLVAGAGALGNEVLKNLALIGIGNIVVVDFETVELPNLSRSVLFRHDDLGRPKAVAACEAVNRLNPEISTTAIDGDLECDLGLGLIRECEIVFGCLDSVHARWILNRLCWRAGRPWINAGMNATVGEVCLHVPGRGACYECGITQQMWRQIHQRRSCLLLPKSLPARTVAGTAVIASLTAALQVQAALAWFHNETGQGGQQLLPGEMLLLSLQPYSLSSFTTAEKHDCLAHETYEPSIFIDAHPAEITVAQLLRQVPDGISLQLDFDILEGWSCTSCGEERVGKRLSKHSGNQVLCPACGEDRTPQLLHEIDGCHWLSQSRLSALGVPARAILRIKTDRSVEYVELEK